MAVYSPEPQLPWPTPNRLAWALLAVPLTLYGLISLWPIAHTLWLSLHSAQHNLYAPQWVGLANYAQLLQTPAFLNSCWHTLALLVVVVPSVMVLATGMALVMNGSWPGVLLARLLVYLPVVVSMVVSGLLWRTLLQEEGLVNQGLALLGVTPIPWLTSVFWVLPALMVVVVWKAIPYYMVMVLARLQSLNEDLLDAAKLDGANTWQRFWHVILPQLLPTLGVVALMSTIGGLKTFGEVYMMTGGGPLHASETLVFYIYERAFAWLDLGHGAAAAVLFGALVMGLDLLQWRLTHGKPAQLGNKLTAQKRK
jgi:putative chitobiose transport system permease protein